MMKISGRLVQAVMRSLFPEPPSTRSGPVPTLVDDTLQAMREWQDAEARFNFVSEPDLVDQTIYTMEACKKRFTYLLGRLRETVTKGRVY